MKAELPGLSVKQVFLLILACSVPMIVKALWYPDYPGADDAFIHLSVINNLTSGSGWAVTPGHPVNVSTSPLFTALMSVLGVFSSNVLFTGMWATTIITLAALFGTFLIARRITADFRIALLATTLAASNVHLWRWSGTFMEASVAFSAVVGIMYCFLHIRALADGRGVLRYGLLGVMIGLAVLLRPELGLLGVTFFLHDALNRQDSLIRRYAAAAAGLFAVVLPYAAWAQSYFGTILPSPFSAKTSSGLILVNATIFGQLSSVVVTGAFVSLGLIGVIAVMALAGGNGRGLADTLKRTAFLWLFPILGFLFYYFKTPQLQSAARYYLPFMATLPIIAASLVPLWRVRRRQAVFLAAGAAQLAAALVINHLMVAPALATMWPGYVSTASEAARVIGEHCSAGQSVLVKEDIGVLATKLDPRCRMRDAGGLASPELQRLPLFEQLHRTRSEFVLESLGEDKLAVERELKGAGYALDLIWQQQFPAHGWAADSRMYTMRLYRVLNPDHEPKG